MRHLRVWGSRALLLAGVGLFAAAGGTGRADDTNAKSTTPASSSHAWQPTWGGGKDRPPAKQADAETPEAKVEEASRTTARERYGARSMQDREKYLRRLKVCDKLKSIAEQTSDTELERLAEQLEERCTTAFMQRASGGFQSDESTLNQKAPLDASPSSKSGAVSPNALSRRAATGRNQEN